MGKKAAMRLWWEPVTYGDGCHLRFGDVIVGMVRVYDPLTGPWAEPPAVGVAGRTPNVPGVRVYEGKSFAAAKRAVRDHVLREMEREVMRAKKARKR